MSANNDDRYFFYPESATAKPSVAISACLNGAPVRYDGSSKVLETTSSILSKHLTLLDICPELAAGMGVPRPPIQLQLNERQQIVAVGRHDPLLRPGAALNKASQASLQELSAQQISGYIFKSRSPSCGLNSTPIYNQRGQQIALGQGIQAEVFQRKMPWLIFCEEQQLLSPAQCHRFIKLNRRMYDLQQAINRDAWGAFHQHYQMLNNRSKLLAQLTAALEQGAVEDYLSLFKRTIESPAGPLRRD